MIINQNQSSLLFEHTRKMKSFQFSLVLLIIILKFFNVDGISKLLLENIESQINARKVNEKFWHILEWYYGRSTYIAITIIKEKNSSSDQSSTVFIQQFHNSIIYMIFFYFI